MSRKNQRRVIREERLPHRAAVQRLFVVYAKLSAAGQPLTSGQTPPVKQEREA